MSPPDRNRDNIEFQPPPGIAPVADGGAARPFWSVMIPAYRPDAAYLRQTLESVLGQDPGPAQMQIEVVDDCSPGVDVAALVRPIAGDRVTVHRSPANLGLAGCWNACIGRARGHWVHVLHQDDLVYPGFYAALRRGIEDHPEVGAAYCRHSYGDENGHWHRLSILELSSPGVLPRFVEALVREERFQCAAIAVRRSTYEKLGGFNPALTHTLDWEMWIRIANQFPIFYEPQILACWRNHAGSTTSRQIRSGENIRDHARAIDIWRGYLPDHEAPRLAAFARERFAYAGLWMAARLLEQNDFEGCRNQVRAALVCQHTFPLQRQAFKMRLRAGLKQILTRGRPRSAGR